MFEDDELEASGRREATPDRNKALVETSRAFSSEDLSEAVDKSIVNLGISRLVHQPGSDNIKRRDGAGHKEAGAEGRHELKGKTFTDHAGVLDRRFHDVVAAHFRGIEHGGSHDVGLDSLVETTDALGCVDLADELAEGSPFTLVCHHPSLQYIEGITGARADSSGQSSCQELGQDAGAGLVSPRESLHRLVEPDAEGGVGCLTHPGRLDPCRIIERR